MLEKAKKSNFQLAQEEANKIDLQIINTLQQRQNFRVEAGAGSGKPIHLIKLSSGFKRTNGKTTTEKINM